jgi:predicted amidophosphoribosyltransferase
MPAAHATTIRPTIAQLISNFILDESLAAPQPRSIALVDDVLTTGAHFVAAKALLAARFAGVPIRGLFVARRVFDVETA